VRNFASSFGKTTSYGNIFKILFRKFSARHRSTLLCSNIVKFGQREIGEIMCYLVDKKTEISPTSQTVATARIAPKICHGQSPTMYSECFRLHPSQFTFDGVIAERVNTAKLPRRVNPIFGGRSLPLSRIMKSRCPLYRLYVLRSENSGG